MEHSGHADIGTDEYINTVSKSGNKNCLLFLPRFCFVFDGSAVAALQQTPHSRILMLWNRPWNVRTVTNCNCIGKHTDETDYKKKPRSRCRRQSRRRNRTKKKGITFDRLDWSGLSLVRIATNWRRNYNKIKYRVNEKCPPAAILGRPSNNKKTFQINYKRTRIFVFQFASSRVERLRATVYRRRRRRRHAFQNRQNYGKNGLTTTPKLLLGSCCWMLSAVDGTQHTIVHVLPDFLIEF